MVLPPVLTTVTGRQHWYDVGGGESGYIAPTATPTLYAGSGGVFYRFDKRNNQEKTYGFACGRLRAWSEDPGIVRRGPSHCRPRTIRMFTPPPRLSSRLPTTA